MIEILITLVYLFIIGILIAPLLLISKFLGG